MELCQVLESCTNSGLRVPEFALETQYHPPYSGFKHFIRFDFDFPRSSRYLPARMGLFTNNEEAKARRTQEREEQQKKAKAVPPPYVHTPTHALNDSLLSVPHAYRGTDKQRLKQAHQERLEKEASALAAGSDTNVTNIPAKYWQGQPLPAQFRAPTPAKLRKLALSSPSIKGKKVKLPVASTAK